MEQIESFSFCIATPWYSTTNSSLCAYTLHNQTVFFGDEKYANDLKKIISERENKEYFIYKLEKLP